MVRLLPWEYGVRNLFRRPLRTGLTFLGLTIVVLLVVAVVGFVRGLERSLAVSGDERVAIVFARGMGENLEYSSVPMRTADLVAAGVGGVMTRYGQKYASPELYLGTRVRLRNESEGRAGIVRGVTPAALLVHNKVELLDGHWPGPGEVLVGRLAATKLGLSSDELATGRTLTMEGREWKVSGTFAAAGASFESELWCRLDDLQSALKRQDLSLVALTLAPDASYSDVELFCAERLDLELQATRETDYFDSLRKGYRPVRWMAWLVVWLVAGAGTLAGLNTMYGSVVGRVRELATLQTVGFLRRSIALSLLQEGLLLSSAASLAAAVIAVLLFRGVTVRFTMSAIELLVDGPTLLIGCGIGLLLGVVGAIPPAIRALRMPIVEGLKAV
jgi:ABC-type lipoprotein release transport system permease subunit